MATLTKPSRIPFSATQRKILLALASAVGLRMLGLFLILPIFTLYGLQFTESRFLVGLSFGAYGLSMACLQIPLGRLSDRIGRKKVLLLGMSIFSLGSFLCAIPGWLPPSWQIFELILARFIQGGGAIISTAFATVADHVEPENRSLAMAVLGIPIGASFVLGVAAGPVLAEVLSTESLFWLTGALGLVSVFLLAHYLPSAELPDRIGVSFFTIVRNRPLISLDLGGFLINFFMSSFFFYFPLLATGQHQLKLGEYYTVLLPMLVISGITTLVFSWAADRGLGRVLAATLFLMLSLSAVLLFRPTLGGLNPQHLAAILIPGTLFFVGFSGLEPILPSMVSKLTPQTAYGTAIGLYNTSQFFGSFVGASVAGALATLSSHHIMTTLASASLAGFLLMLALPPLPGASPRD